MNAPTRRAVVVEDERPLARLVAGYLEREGYDVTPCHDGDAAGGVLRAVDPDLVVLDLGLPGRDGVDVCRELRTWSDAYVVVLTARSGESQVLDAFAAGADDYVTKPFSPRELAARVRALQRRPVRAPGAAAPPPVVHGVLTVDVGAGEARVDGEPVALTPTELRLLAALATEPGRTFRREDLLGAVWGAPWVGDAHAADVHVANLRRKLGDDAATQRFVRTVRGVGYRMGTA